jgi:FkbM family methyltransferase
MPARVDSLPMQLLRRWTRLRLPRSARLLQRAGVWDQERWTGEPVRVCRGCWHGYRLALDTGNYHQRGAYFYGRLLDVPVQLCMLAALEHGDTCIDVGANIGMLSLLAAHAVGPHGKVIAFEPNPDVFERLQWHIGENRLRHVEAHQLALSDHEAMMRLSVPPTGNTGAGTLGRLPARFEGRVGAAYKVPVRIGDEVLGSLPNAPLLIKLDVEGHETLALRGLTTTIARHGPAILLEANADMLRGNGSSVEELFALLQVWGYVPHALKSMWSRVTRDWRLRLEAKASDWRPARTENVLFLRPGGLHARRLAQLMQPAPAAK